MKISNLLAMSATVVLFSACSYKPSAPMVTDRDGVNAISSTSDLQTTFIKKHGDLDRYCAARPSDVADTSSSGASIGASEVGEGGNISDGSSQGAVSLGGRNPAVLIVREMMYRACELTMNLNTDTNQSITIYNSLIQAMKDIVVSQTGTGTTSLSAKANQLVNISDTSTSKSSDSTSDDKSTSKNSSNSNNNSDNNNSSSDSNDTSNSNSSNNSNNSSSSDSDDDDGF